MGEWRLHTGTDIITLAHATPASTPDAGDMLQGKSSEKPASTNDGGMNFLESLSTGIDESLLRGVSAEVVLRGFGASLRKHEFRQEDYVRSVSADRLDDFISHDWASGWCGKALALCLLYNSMPATVASLLAACVLAALQTSLLDVLPAVHVELQGTTQRFGFMCEAICPIVFAVVFVFWQDIRAALRLPARMLFLDKYCIDQEDVSRKAAGIAGLAGFLKHTDRLVILWTPRYFTRLWCAYEMASWLYLRKPMRQVAFIPLSHVKGIVIAGVASCTLCILYAFAAALYPGLDIPMLFGAFVVIFPMMTHMTRRLIHEISQLPEQLRSFRVAESGCFCCDSGHRVPGQPSVTLPCDREVVYETLRSWFQGHVTEGDGAQRANNLSCEDFDEQVRRFFGPWVLQQAGPTEFPYRVVALLGLPWLFRAFDILACIGEPCAPFRLRAGLIGYPVTALAIVPIIYKVTIHLTLRINARVGIPRDRCLDVMTSAVCSLFPACVHLVVWLPLTMGNRGSLCHGLVFASVDVLIALVVFRRSVYRSWLGRWMGCAAETTPSARSSGKRTPPRSRQRDPEQNEEAPAAAPNEQALQAVEVHIHPDLSQLN